MTLDPGLGVACTFFIITAFIELIILMIFIRNFYGSKRQKNLIPSIKRSSLLFAVSCCLRMIFLAIHYVGKAIGNTQYSTLVEDGDEKYELIISDWSGMASDVFLFTSKLMLYWYLIIRLKISFKESVYGPSKKVFYILTVFMVTLLIITVILIVFFLIYVFDEPFLRNYGISSYFLLCVMAILMISDFIISTLILYSFSRGLYQLVLVMQKTIIFSDAELIDMKNDTELADAADEFGKQCEMDNIGYIPPSGPSMESTYSHSNQSQVQFIDVAKGKHILKQASDKLASRQEKLVNMVAKTTLLSSIAIASTFIFLGIRILISIIDENNIVILSYSILCGFDSVLDLCAIYLNFPFAKKLYQKLCFRCDNFCFNKCRKIASKGIYKQNKDKLFGKHDYQPLYNV